MRIIVKFTLKKRGYILFRFYSLLFILFIFTGCASKQLYRSDSALILIKTPKLKFYDKGFIKEYSDRLNVQIFSAGVNVLDMNIYETQVCISTFECLDLDSFNKEYLSKNYNKEFLKELFSKKEKKTLFRDRENRVLIKIIRD